MGAKPVFAQSDFDSRERVRQIVLYRLKEDREWHQLDLWTGLAGPMSNLSIPSCTDAFCSWLTR